MLLYMSLKYQSNTHPGYEDIKTGDELDGTDSTERYMPDSSLSPTSLSLCKPSGLKLTVTLITLIMHEFLTPIYSYKLIPFK